MDDTELLGRSVSPWHRAGEHSRGRVSNHCEGDPIHRVSTAVKANGPLRSAFQSPLTYLLYRSADGGSNKGGVNTLGKRCTKTKSSSRRHHSCRSNPEHRRIERTTAKSLVKSSRSTASYTNLKRVDSWHKSGVKRQLVFHEDEDSGNALLTMDTVPESDLQDSTQCDIDDDAHEVDVAKPLKVDGRRIYDSHYEALPNRRASEVIANSGRRSKFWKGALLLSLTACVYLSTAYIFCSDIYECYLSGKAEDLGLDLPSLKTAQSTLREVVNERPLRFLSCFSMIYLFKQTFAVPGSALLNIAAGSFLPLHTAFPLTCILTALGASACYCLSWTIADRRTLDEKLERFAPGQLENLRWRTSLAQARGELIYFLLFLRIFPFSPNWFLNLSSPWLRIPLHQFCLSVFFGLAPYNFLTVQAGTFLMELSSPRDIFSAKFSLFLCSVALASLLPVAAKRWRRKPGGLYDDLKSS